MLHIKKIEEHILDNIESNNNFLDRITSIDLNDLVEGNSYNHTKLIKISDDEYKKLRTTQKFLKKQNNFYIFRIVKIHTPEIAEKMNIKIKDLIKVKESDLSFYHL